MLIMPYDTESQSRNADFISIAHKGNPQPSAQRAVKLKNLKNLKNPFPLWYCVPPSPRRRWDNHRGPKAPSNLRTLRPRGRSILRTFPSEPFEPFEPSHRRCVQWRSRAPLFFKICGVSRHHHPRPERPSNLRTLRTLGAQPRQPSRRRRVPCPLFHHS